MLNVPFRWSCNLTCSNMYINKLAIRRNKMEVVVLHIFIHQQREGVE